MTPQQAADRDLATWQRLRSEGLDPAERMAQLMKEFFSSPKPCDVQYNAMVRDVAEIMEAA